MNKVSAAEWVRCLTRVRVDTFGAVGLATGLAEGLRDADVTPEEAGVLAAILEDHERKVRKAPDLAEIYRGAAKDLRGRFYYETDVRILTFNAPEPAPW